MLDSTRSRPALFRGPYRLLSWSVCALISIYAFEEMGVAAALPTAVTELGGLADFGWVYTGFLAVSVVGMASSTLLCDRHGPRVAVYGFAALFLAGLVFAGTATTMLALIAGRVVQGLAGGGLMTAVYVLVGTLVPDDVRPRLFAVIAFCWVIPGIVGPTVSGAVTEHFSWRWSFLGLVPATVVALALLMPALSDDQAGAPDAALPRPRGSPRSRVVAALFAAGGIAAIQAGAGSLTGLAPVLVGAGIAVLAWALRTLLPPGTVLLRSAVGAPVALRGLTAGALFGVEAVIPLMMATQHHLGPLRASLPLACAGLPCAIAAWALGRIAGEGALEKRVRLARAGFGMLCVADVAFALASQPSSVTWLMIPTWVIAGFGIGLVVPTANVLVLERTTFTDRASDASALQIADTTTACITTGFAGVLLSFASRGLLGYTTAFTVIGVSMASLAMAGAVATGRLRVRQRGAGEVVLGP